MDHLAILTSGGDAPGMNSAIKTAYTYANQEGFKTFFIRRGLTGLVEGLIEEGTDLEVQNIIHCGGTILGSSREPSFLDPAIRQKAYDNLKSHNIKKLIVIGGDGSFQAFHQFTADFPDIRFVGIPATIDNDIAGTDYCLGVDTALNTIRQSIDSIRDTATSFYNRAFVIEVMGRRSGYLAMTTALSSNAEVCLAPELENNIDSIVARLRRLKEEGRTYFLCIVAEGTKMTDYLTRHLQDCLNMECRCTILGHIQRGGTPSVLDRIRAHQFATQAVEILLKGGGNSVINYTLGKYAEVPIEQVADIKDSFDPLLIKSSSDLSK